MNKILAKLQSIFLDNAALKIAGIYAGFSALWILFSDQLVSHYVQDAETLTRIQMLKGWLFIAVTALIVYSLLQKEITRLQRAEAEVHAYRDHLEDLVKTRTQSLEREILERQQAEKKFRDLLESAPDALIMVDSQARIVLVNRQMEILFGYAREELLDESLEILIPGRYRESHRGHVREYLGAHRSRPMGVGLAIFGLTKHGAEFPADISLSPLETGEGIFVLAAIRDITERKRAEEKIRKSYYFESTINAVLKIAQQPLPLEERLDRILEAILAIPLMHLQRMGSIYLVEDKPEFLVLKAQRGYDEAVRAGCVRVPFGACRCGKAAPPAGPAPPDCLAQCDQCYHGIFPPGHYSIPIVFGPTVLGMLNLVFEEGHTHDEQEEEFLSSIAATLAGLIVRTNAELEKNRLRQQLLEAEKQLALGRMMANVAHEIRNPLTALGGLARRLDKKIPESAREKEYTRVMVSESTRLERILKSVLRLTGESMPQKEETDPNAIIEASLQFLDPAIQKKLIEVKKTLAGLAPVPMDREAVREVIDSLLANAVYATPVGGGISIVTAAEAFAGKHCVTVEVSDTGPGIPEEIRDKIFEPFFTTKPVGPEHGIGLGLSISKKIMEEHGGRIEVQSRIGEGATFKLFFPCPGAPRSGAKSR